MAYKIKIELFDRDALRFQRSLKAAMLLFEETGASNCKTVENLQKLNNVIGDSITDQVDERRINQIIKQP